MRYYRVNKEYDNKRRTDGGFYVGNELYTEKELIKIGANPNSPIFKPIDISKNMIYWFFGARFECGKDIDGNRF